MKKRVLHQPNWPDLDYPNIDFQVLGNNSISSAIVTKIKNYAHVDTDSLLYEINDLTDLYNDIKSSICNCDIDDLNQITNIFHKIEIWGGRAAGVTYTKDGGFSKNIDINSYKELVKACTSINGNDDISLELIYNKAESFNQNCSNIGVSFISKHIFFWTYKSLGNYALPIYDRYIACGLYSRQPELDQIFYYWQDMIKKAESDNVSIQNLERALFNRFRYK